LGPLDFMCKISEKLTELETASLAFGEVDDGGLGE
jgi:hypothetical protein